MAKYMVNYGDKEIHFDLERKNVKNINLNIRPDMSIAVSANEKVPLECIKEFVKEQGPWILKNIKYFEKFEPVRKPAKEYVSGESFKYLGRQYRLQVRESEEENVKYFRGYIYLYVKDTRDYKKKEKLFNMWLNEKAILHFNDSLERMFESIKSYNIPKPKIKIREMKARWGSCHRKDKILLLNSELIKAPKHCIDYVVLHELIHFKYKNHDTKFYTFLTSLMPDWERRKKILDEEVVKDL
ncbi:MAG: M48 family metallopeptidase [Desulfitobacterium sp.]|nr:M48 family metallopeptidase [Desulfitobacterium sp.]